MSVQNFVNYKIEPSKVDQRLLNYCHSLVTSPNLVPLIHMNLPLSQETCSFDADVNVYHDSDDGKI